MSEPEYTWADVFGFLEKMSAAGLQPVVVGGQALNFWVEFFRATGAFDEAPYTSKDLDLLGSPPVVKRAAEIVNGRAFVPRLDDMTPEIGYVTVPLKDGRELRVDFLEDSVPNSREDVLKQAVPLEGGVVRVMHPLACLRTRAYNVVKIAHKYDTGHGRRQLAGSITVVACLCDWLLDRQDRGLDHKAVRKVLRIYQEVFELSRGDLGKSLRHHQGIDVFSPIVTSRSGLPEEFATEALPRWREQLGLDG